MPLLQDSQIMKSYRDRTAMSRELAHEARGVIPSGIVHDARRLDPYPIYVERSDGSRKWDVDGNEYVDYVGGHGSLLFGHNHQDVTRAVTEQLLQGTHYGACHKLEVEWAGLVRELMPSGELVRFTNSGTEATHLAARVVRAFTGRSRIVRFIGHFHGWQDHVAFGVSTHQDGSPSAGVLHDVAEKIVLCQPGEIERLREILTEDRDIAAVMIEPTGASWGDIPRPRYS